jgi:hypothetical protein
MRMRLAFAAVLASAALAPSVSVLAQNAAALNLNQARGMAARPGETGGAVHQAFTEPLTASKIRAAIDDGVQFLRDRQLPDGSWARNGYNEGNTALATLTLLAAGGDPQGDTQLMKALDYLSKQAPDNIYDRALRANVWEYALRKDPENAQFKKNLTVESEWLLAALGEKEGWRYTKAASDWDNSCTQYGVLGLWACARAGIDPGEKFWKTMSRHFLTSQGADGGWSYTGNSSPTANMATAGLASLFLVLDQHVGKTFFTAEKPRTFAEGEAAAVLGAIDKGMAWLARDRGQKSDAYFLYGMERTGVASGLKVIGGEDWFKSGALVALKLQRRDGCFTTTGFSDDINHTALTVLFLVYGGAPVAYNKLEYGKDQDWNNNPRDLANLSKFLWSAYEAPLNWQSVSLAGDAAEFEAPILFISGSRDPKFSEGEIAKLREYVLRGGTILAEPSDHAKDFDGAMRTLAAKMFPAADYPNYKLEPLPENHGVFTVIKQEFKARPKLQGISDGSRTFFFLSEDYMSADFQMARENSDAFKLAMNLLFYATDLGTLEGKFSTTLPDTPPARERKEAFTVARVQYSGGHATPREWDAAALAWTKLAPYLKHIAGCKVKESAAVTLGTSDLKDIKLLHLTGRTDFAFTAAEKKALKDYVAAGGTVLVDAYAGSAAFAASARRQLEEIFGPLAPLAPQSVLAEGRFEGGQDLHALALKLPTRQALRAKGQQPQGQKLLVALDGKRSAVIFSDLDISGAMAGVENFKSQGYKPASARKIVGNLAALLTAE